MNWLERATRRWDAGRQGGGYRKKRLFQIGRLAMDAYLIYYPDGTKLMRHSDPIEGRRHFRLNLTLIKPPKGGRLMCDEPILRFSRLAIFRSDASHRVTKIIGGPRLVLSLGWAPRA